MITSERPALSDRLMRIVETNAESLTQQTVRMLLTSSRTPSYHKLAYNELYDRVFEVYRDLRRWLSKASEEMVRACYMDLGEKRRAEGIRLSEVLWALTLTKNRLVEYLGEYALADSAMELYQQHEFERLLDHFFERAVCYAAEGYERHASSPPKVIAATADQDFWFAP